MTRWNRMVGTLACAGALLTNGFVFAETLDEAMRYAFRNSPEINATRATVRASSETIKQTRAGLLPQINLSAAYGISGQEVLNDWVTSDQASATLSASLLLYDGAQTQNGIRAAESDTNAAALRLQSAEQQLFLQVANVYIGVLRAQSSVELFQSNIEQSRTQLRSVQIRFDEGAADASERAQAEATLAGAEADLLLAQADLKTAEASYQQVVGRAPNGLQNVSAPSLPGSLDAALASARVNAPLIKAAIETERAAQYRLRQAQGAKMPTVSLSGSGTLTNDLEGETTPSSSVGLNLSMPLYSGGRISSLARQAEALLTARANDTNNARTLVEQNTRTSWSSVEGSRAALDATKTARDAQQVAVRAAQIQYDEGILDLNNLLVREQALLSSQLNVREIGFQNLLASYQLLFAMGVLGGDEYGVKIQQIDPLKAPEGENAPSDIQTTIDTIADRWSR